LWDRLFNLQIRFFTVFHSISGQSYSQIICRWLDAVKYN
jgi:hypothetical protein